MKQFFLAMLSIIAFGCSDEKEVTIESEPFVGNWSTIEVFKDSHLQTEWSNADLLITQENLAGGTYQMVNTPYDSIWSATGSWSALHEQPGFLLDEEIEVKYWMENDTLYLLRYLPWTSIPCVPNEVCTLIITGQWEFKFKKKE